MMQEIQAAMIKSLVPARWDGAGAGLRVITITGLGKGRKKQHDKSQQKQSSHQKKSNHIPGGGRTDSRVRDGEW